MGRCVVWLVFGDFPKVVLSFEMAGNINWATQRYISQVTDIVTKNAKNNKQK
jgi:hypothetical protein